MTWLNKLWTFITLNLGPHSLFSIVRNSLVWSHFRERKKREGREEGNCLSSSSPNISLASRSLFSSPFFIFFYFIIICFFATHWNACNAAWELVDFRSLSTWLLYIIFMLPFGSTAFVCTLSSLLEEVASCKCLASLHSSTLSSVCPSVPSGLWH